MAAIAQFGHILRFGAFEVDTREHELRKKGIRLRLQGQPLEVLILLAKHSGELVTREQLRAALWPTNTFVDFDHSLNNCIARIREVLDDSADSPRFIETVHRRGYRFVSPVEDVSERLAPAAVEQDTPLQSADGTARQRRTTALKLWFIIAMGLLLTSTVMGWLIVYRLRQPTLRQSDQIRQWRLTAHPDEDRVLGAAISPDGKYLAFSDKTGFYLRQVDSGETHPLNLPPNFVAVPVAWYPDGSHLVAARPEGPTAPSTLWQVSIMGGTPHKLIDDGRLAAVSRDGQIAFVKGPKLKEEIWIMGANGENRRRLVTCQSCTFGMPAWAPNGRQIAYVMGSYAEEQWQVKPSVSLLHLDDGRRETISLSSFDTAIHADRQLGSGLIWTTDNYLVYSVSEPLPNQGDSNLWSVPLSPNGHVVGPAHRLTAAADEVSSLSVSADGKRIVYVKDSLNPDIYVSELDSGSRRLSPPRRLSLDNWRDVPFSWTPDSKAVLFVSDRDGTYHIFKQSIDQTVPELLVGGNEEAGLPRLAPDNSTVLYETWPKLGETPKPRRLMRVSLAGGPPEDILQHDGIGNMQCARPPSTLCLYEVQTASQKSFFSFDPATGKSEELPQIRIQDEAPSAFNWSWSLSPDGNVLATAKEAVQKNPSITFYTLKDGSKRSVTTKGWASIGSIDFAADGHSVWASAYVNAEKWALLNIDLQGRTRIVLEDTKTIGWAIPSPDGRHLAFWEGRESSNVWMLERF